MLLKMIKLPIFLLMSTFILVGCQNMGEQQRVGTVLGTVAGGLIGAQFGNGAGHAVGAAVGGVVGGVVGNVIGATLDQSDARYADRAFQEATRTATGETVYWSNPRSGRSGYYRALRDGSSNCGRYCREFETTCITCNGCPPQRVYGTACRHPNGTWYLN